MAAIQLRGNFAVAITGRISEGWSTSNLKL
jgi:hypothetical protein